MPCIRNGGGVRPLPFLLYVPAVSNVVTTGNGTGTKCFKMEPMLGFEFSIHSSVFGATTVAKVILFSPGHSLL